MANEVGGTLITLPARAIPAMLVGRGEGCLISFSCSPGESRPQGSNGIENGFRRPSTLQAEDADDLAPKLTLQAHERPWREGDSSGFRTSRQLPE